MHSRRYVEQIEIIVGALVGIAFGTGVGTFGGWWLGLRIAKWLEDPHRFEFPPDNEDEVPE